MIRNRGWDELDWQMKILSFNQIELPVLLMVSLFFMQFFTANDCMAVNRYWVSTTPGNWNNPANWSNTIGGSGGYSVPTASDNAVFNANGIGDCELDVSVNLLRIGINGYTGTIDLSGYDITIAASTRDMTFSSGTLTGSGALNITTTGKMYFSGTSFGVPVIINAGDFQFGTSVFNATSSFTKTGSNTPLTGGGCTFNGETSFANSGVTDLYLSTINTDIFNSDVTFTSTNAKIMVATGFHGAAFNGNVYVESSSSNIEIGDHDPLAGVSTLASGKVLAIGGGGFTSGELKIANLQQLGTTPQSIATGAGTKVYINNGCEWNGNVTIIAPEIYVSGSTFEGSASFTKSNSSLSNYSDGGNTFNGPVHIELANSNGNLTFSTTLPNVFNDEVTFKTSGSGTGILYAAVWPGTEINGNFIIDSPSGLVEFPPGVSILIKGSIDQSLSTAVGTPDLIINNLEINNADADLILNSPLTVAASLVLTQGNIVTTSTNLLTLSDDVTVTGASDASFVQGPLKKIGDDAFTFPVGFASNYQPISIEAPAMATDAFTAAYVREDPGLSYDNLSLDISLSHISHAEYWILDRTAGSSDTNVTLSWNTKSGGIDDPSKLRVARWNGSMWEDHGNGGTTGTVSEGTIVTSSPITSFSPFTFASITSSSNPLPIELVFFEADIVDKGHVRLKWQTASEVNNDYFTIERSIDAANWQVIKTIEGAGNSNTRLDYSLMDTRPYPGISYYRLKQTDYDGQFEYFRIVAVNSSETDLTKVFIFPNPTISHVILEGSAMELKVVKLYDINGNDFTGKVSLSTHSPYRKSLDITDLSSGIYFIKTASSISKIVKK